MALRHGYSVLEVGELWHWEQRTTELFKGYIKTFLKSKTEASGWPVDCGDDPAKRASFIANFEAREGVQLDENNMAKNEGLRFISKLLLNSFWGYLGMRDNLPQIEYVDNYGRLLQLINSETVTVEDVCMVGDDLVVVQYRDKDEFVTESPNTNVILAAITTAHARCCLYEVK